MTQFRLNAARLMASAASVVLLAVAPAVHADALQDISKQIKQGQHAQALEQVDKYLAGKPKDAQGRFLKGIVLAEMNKPNEAIVVFTKLTEDYPELPEPYNNLAVIYAQQKQYDKAKQALEMAIRTHPSYATAHENLGDIYARLASQAYDKALQIDSSNPSAQKKLALIRDLMGTAGRPSKTTKPIGEPTLGLGAELDPIGMVSWTNCACGNTLILHCEDGAGEMHGRFLRALETESQASSRSIKELLQVLRSDIRSRVLERS